VFDSINDPNIRQQLCNQYRQIIQQSKDEMMKIYMTSAEAQMHQCHKQFNDELKQIWQEQQSLPIKQRLNEVMLDLIEQRHSNISERVKLMYKLKAHKLDFNFLL